MGLQTVKNNLTELKRYILDLLRDSFFKVGVSYLFFLLLIVISLLLTILISQGLASDGNSSSPEAMGGTVALSTMANQAIEAVKKKMRGEDIPPQNSEAIKVLEYKIQAQEKQVIQLWRKLRHIESFLTRATKSFNPKETRHD
jgi:hypothetical protein